MKNVLSLFIELLLFVASAIPVKAEVVNAIVTGEEAGVVLLMLPGYDKEAQLATDRQMVVCEGVETTLDAHSPRTVVIVTRITERLETHSTRYKYTFGDGTHDYGGSEMRHTYAQPGTYEVKVEIYDEWGRRYDDERCQTTVSVAQTAVSEKERVRTHTVQDDRNVIERFRDTFRRTETQAGDRLECQQLTIESTRQLAVPETLTFKIDARRGAANAVPAAEYRIDYGDGSTDTNTSGRFSHTFTRAGEYVVQGYVREQGGSWSGGDFCQRRINVSQTSAADPGWVDRRPPTTKGGVDTMTTQPATGPGIWVLAGSGLSALAGLGWRLKHG
jgi:hypothetical protein